MDFSRFKVRKEAKKGQRKGFISLGSRNEGGKKRISYGQEHFWQGHKNLPSLSLSFDSGGISRKAFLVSQPTPNEAANGSWSRPMIRNGLDYKGVLIGKEKNTHIFFKYTMHISVTLLLEGCVIFRLERVTDRTFEQQDRVTVFHVK